MKSGKNRKPVTCRLLTSLLGIACFAVTAQPAFSEDGPPVSPGQTQTGSAASAPQPGGGGMTVYVDPQTGAVLSEPAPGTQPLPLSPQEQNALSTSHQGLVEVPSGVPGGGFKLDLKGRFQSPLIATIDANGKIRMQHLGEPAETSEQK